MERLWFAAKRYGYGWYPATWEGWLVMLAYIALVLAPVAARSAFGGVQGTTFRVIFIPYVCILTIVLLVICVKKGEPARWRWGK